MEHSARKNKRTSGASSKTRKPSAGRYIYKQDVGKTSLEPIKKKPPAADIPIRSNLGHILPRGVRVSGEMGPGMIQDGLL